MILAGGFVTLGLVVLNIVIALKNNGCESFSVSMIVHVLGLALVAANVARLWESATNTTIVGNAIAFIFILVSLRRAVRRYKDGGWPHDKNQTGI